MPKAVGWLGSWKYVASCCGREFPDWDLARLHEIRKGPSPMRPDIPKCVVSKA
jgi:hypothetical protein